MKRIIPKGEHVILAHLRHLKDHGEKELVKQGLDYLKHHNIPINLKELHPTPKLGCGCPGSMARELKPVMKPTVTPYSSNSELRQWPVQLHLLNPQAGYEAVKESGGGLVSPACDQAALAANLLALYRMAPEGRAALGAKAKAYYEAHYRRTELLRRLESFTLRGE